MRTTIDLDDDVLQAARELAAARRSTLGKVVSELARRSLEPRPAQTRIRSGVPLLTPGPDTQFVGIETVNRLRDEE